MWRGWWHNALHAHPCVGLLACISRCTAHSASSRQVAAHFPDTSALAVHLPAFAAAYCQLFGRNLETGQPVPYDDAHWRQVIGRLGLSEQQVWLSCAAGHALHRLHACA
jgi:hypothetical protein